MNAATAAVGYPGLVEGGRGVRSALGLSFLAHQSPQFQHEFPSLSGQPPASVSTQSLSQQQPSTTSIVPSSTAQHHSLLLQQSYSHNHSGGLLLAIGSSTKFRDRICRTINALCFFTLKNSFLFFASDVFLDSFNTATV